MNKLIVKALKFAEHKHRFQCRKDSCKSPYIKHPIDLLSILVNEADITDENVLCAALLHDTIEDTDTSAEELRIVFGEKITNIVLEVTDDKDLPKQERKELQVAHAAHSSPEAKLVKFADKIANVRDIKIDPPQGWDQLRIDEYYAWSKRVIDQLRGTNETLETLFDRAVDG